MGNSLDLRTLIAVVERISKERTDGHFAIMKFSTEWKAMLGTPNLDSCEGRKEISQLPGYETIEEALLGLVTRQ